ncbi:Uncharacterized protein OS=Flavobacterium hydatis GN=IW20_03645 PE=4 SV=1 [Gemmata massiliana]|uniref:Uncharacterized protein n=1 Tax=Gemmata massiliana TaxID=1210884 RepID=A0A6P2CXK9_9BACT|nr:hypothetical protein [Gemmata massiliana]VTR93623.1 Uncharacterized protein OS=Flavobacterium hydatis GN=IW20_03645 PE=4 SV=1 [Gemmata massiliana]
MTKPLPFQLWLEFEHWIPQEGDDLETDFFNMQVTLACGTKYALNVWTFKYLSKSIEECSETGEYLSGCYHSAPDLFVARLDRALIERVVADLIAQRALKEEWKVPAQLEDS